MTYTPAHLRAIARASCSWCDGSGAYSDGRPCILCAGQRLSKRQQRWRFETRCGMSYELDPVDPPVWARDVSAEAEAQRYSGDVTRHGYGRW